MKTIMKTVLHTVTKTITKSMTTIMKTTAPIQFWNYIKWGMELSAHHLGNSSFRLNISFIFISQTLITVPIHMEPKILAPERRPRRRMDLSAHPNPFDSDIAIMEKHLGIYCQLSVICWTNSLSQCKHTRRSRNWGSGPQTQHPNHITHDIASRKWYLWGFSRFTSPTSRSPHQPGQPWGK